MGIRGIVGRGGWHGVSSKCVCFGPPRAFERGFACSYASQAAGTSMHLRHAHRRPPNRTGATGEGAAVRGTTHDATSALHHRRHRQPRPAPIINQQYSPQIPACTAGSTRTRRTPPCLLAGFCTAHIPHDSCMTHELTVVQRPPAYVGVLQPWISALQHRHSRGGTMAGFGGGRRGSRGGVGVLNNNKEGAFRRAEQGGCHEAGMCMR